MKKLKRLLYSWIDKTLLGGCSSYNSLATRKRCRSKKQAREAFAANGIPHARGRIFLTPMGAFRFVRQYGFPVVIKPNVGGFSRGSYFPISGYWQLLKASILVKIWWPTSVIEQYLEGRNYRIVVLAEGIMSVIRRYPPFVVGDGKSTIRQLIERENRIREQMQLYPVIHPIEKGKVTRTYLHNQGLDYNSVAGEGMMVTLHNRIALAPGGVVETIDKQTVHPDNRELFLRIPPLFGANILGIDAIFTKGIEVSHLEQKVVFLEVNSRPFLKMHHYPRFGRKEDLHHYYETLDRLDIAERDVF